MRAKAIKAGLYQGRFKYKYGYDQGFRPLLLRGSTVATCEKDTDIEQWEKDVKEGVKFSFETLRDKLALYARLSLCVFSSLLNQG